MQACLPFSFGGFGIRSAVGHAAGAYLASVSSAARLDKWKASDAVGWADALQDFFKRGLSFLEGSPRQKDFSLAVDKASFSRLLEGASEHDKARLLAVSSPGASSWLGVIPSAKLRQVYEPREFTTLLRFWTGQKLTHLKADCPFCDQAMDPRGYHALTCRKSGSLGIRHNALREAFLHFCHVAKWDARREVPDLIKGTASRPADILLPGSSLSIPKYSSSFSTCLDFAVCHNQQSKYIKKASVESGAAATGYEESVKMPRYLAECTRNKLNFIPMVVEVFGAWGKSARPVMENVARAVSSTSVFDEEKAQCYLRQGLSVVLQRQNARTLLKFFDPSLPCVSDPVPAPQDSGQGDLIPWDDVADDLSMALPESMDSVSFGSILGDGGEFLEMGFSSDEEQEDLDLVAGGPTVSTLGSHSPPQGGKSFEAGHGYFTSGSSCGECAHYRASCGPMKNQETEAGGEEDVELPSRPAAGAAISVCPSKESLQAESEVIMRQDDSKMRPTLRTLETEAEDVKKKCGTPVETCSAPSMLLEGVPPASPRSLRAREGSDQRPASHVQLTSAMRKKFKLTQPHWPPPRQVFLSHSELSAQVSETLSFSKTKERN